MKILSRDELKKQLSKKGICSGLSFYSERKLSARFVGKIYFGHDFERIESSGIQ